MNIENGIKKLNDFNKKIRAVGNKLSNQNVLIALAEAAVKKAKEEYAKNSINSVSVSYEINGDTVSIIANGDSVAFLEYGTGDKAKGTYKGNLPQSGVPITGKWEYYYDSEYKDTVDGVKGWWLKVSVFVTGNEAGNYMWNVRNYMVENARAIILNAYKGI